MNSVEASNLTAQKTGQQQNNFPDSKSDSGEFYKILLENAFEGIGVISAEGNVKYYSPNISKILGQHAESGIGKAVFESIHPNDIQKSFDILQSLIREPQTTRHTVIRFKHCDGSWRWLEMEARNLLAVPAIEGIIINFRDVSEKVEIENSLSESDKRYRSLIENAFDGITIINEVGTVKYHSPSLLSILGYRPLSGVGGSIFNLLHPADVNRARQTLEKVLKTKNKLVEITLQFKHKNETWVNLEVRCINLFDQPGIEGILLNYRDVTERKAMERALLESEFRYRQLTQISPVGIFRTDEKGFFTYANEKWTSISGLSFENSLGYGWAEAIDARDKEKCLNVWKTALKHKKLFELEYRINSPDGKTTWVYTQSTPEFDKSGNFKGYVGSITDITERVLAEEALAKSERHKSALVNAIPDMIFRIDRNGIYIDFKPAESFGPLLPPEEFLGKTINDVMPPDIAKSINHLIHETFKTNQTQTLGYYLPDFENPSRLNYFESRSAPCDNEEVVVLVRDFTSQKEAEESLKASEEKWRSLVKNAPQYVVTIDENDCVTFINYLKFLKPEQIIGKHIYELPFKYDTKILSKMLKKARSGKIAEGEFSLVDFNHMTLWYNVRISPIKTGNEIKDLILMISEITERKNAERELMETNKKLKALYHRLENIREEEKKNIAMEIHDELGQELTAIRLGMFWMQQYMEQKGHELAAWEPLHQKVKSLIHLSSQTLNSARNLAHQLRPVVLDNLGLIPAIEWQINNLRENSGIQIFFNHNIENLLVKEGFAMAIYRIIQESLTNIIRHSGASEASVNLNMKEKEIHLEIIDNGRGIRKKDLALTGKFGIFGMQERAKTWNGKFTIDEKSNKGTRLVFIFSLKEILKK